MCTIAAGAALTKVAALIKRTALGVKLRARRPYCVRVRAAVRTSKMSPPLSPAVQQAFPNRRRAERCFTPPVETPLCSRRGPTVTPAAKCVLCLLLLSSLFFFFLRHDLDSLQMARAFVTFGIKKRCIRQLLIWNTSLFFPSPPYLFLFFLS